MAGRRLLVLVNSSASLLAGLAPLVVDDGDRWLAIRPDPLAYGMLFRPELKPGIMEDMVMEAKRGVPDNIDALFATARAEWPAMQETTDRVLVALVKELDLMTERRKPPVIPIEVSDR